MKTVLEINPRGYGKKYRYYCDRCGQEINFKEKTLKQVYIKHNDRTSKKLCDLCDKCYKSLVRGVFKKKGEQKI